MLATSSLRSFSDLLNGVDKNKNAQIVCANGVDKNNCNVTAVCTKCIQASNGLGGMSSFIDIYTLLATEVQLQASNESSVRTQQNRSRYRDIPSHWSLWNSSLSGALQICSLVAS